VVTDFLGAAENWVESYCDRILSRQTTTGTYNGDGGKRLYLRNTPVSSITSATITDLGGNVETLTPSTDLSFQADNGGVEFGPNNTSGYDKWPEGFRNISIVYVAGYTLGTDMPDAIEEAVCLRALCIFAESAENMSAGLVSQSMGEISKSRTTPYIIDGWMAQVASLLAPYRRLQCPVC
jgi:hypothetical protein